jgi:CotY/CotZ family spore coat protein
MDMCHPNHEKKTKKCFWDLHGFNERDRHCFEHDHDENDHHEHHEGCVGDVLEAILHAQEKAKKQDDCHHSCKESISDLLEEKKRPKKNTIPFLLFRGDCEPFKASGVKVVKNHHTKKKKFAYISSFIFKIKDLNDGCAVLELLTFKPDRSCNSDHKEIQKNPCSPCCQIDHKDVDDLIGTGICITVDLACFCAISCLPAIFIK